MKFIPGYENLYLIDESGNVSNWRRDKFLKQHKSIWGYMRVMLYKHGVAKSLSIHRLVAITYLLNPENKPQVNHMDGNKLNNHVSNLEWVTQQENMDHAYAMGLVGKPDCSARIGVPLTEEVKQKIRESTLGEKNHFYGKSHSQETIEKIRAKKIGQKPKNVMKKVECITTGTIYNSITEAAIDLDVNAECITMCCKGRIQTTASKKLGCKTQWKYV